ncbi:MAG TPA: hypothetical protein VG028_17930 [Terriglobia bacterium]|nr:hypothetical protein [Terriglobia bacterium]
MSVLELNHRWIPVEMEPGQPYEWPSSVSSHMQELYCGPCVYRWALFRSGTSKPYMVYVGEGESLVKRLRGYLTPDRSQVTNIRIKRTLETELQNGSKVELHTLEFDSIDLLIDKDADKYELIAMDRLQHPFIRRMMENVTILLHDAINTEILNRALNPIERRRIKALKLMGQ